MRSSSIDGVAGSHTRRHASLQSLQVGIKRATDLRKRCCCCSRGYLPGSALVTVPHVQKLGHVGLLHAAAVEDVGLTSPSQSDGQGSAGRITRTQPRKYPSTATKHHASNRKPGSGAAAQRKKARKNPPHKANLPSADLQDAYEVTATVSKEAGVELRLSQLETAYKKHDPGSCHRAVQQLTHLVEGISADQLLADASPAVLKAWWRKLQQDATASKTCDSGSQSSALPLPINGDQHHGNGNTLSSSAAQSLTSGGEHMHAKLLPIAQQMEPAQRIDMFLHRYHPKLVQLWLATGHQDWAQHYIAMLPPVLPTATYNSFVASCEKYHSVKTLSVVLEVCSACSLLHSLKERHVLCRAVLCCAVMCCAVLCCAVLCCAVLCCAELTAAACMDCMTVPYLPSGPAQKLYKDSLGSSNPPPLPPPGGMQPLALCVRSPCICFATHHDLSSVMTLNISMHAVTLQQLEHYTSDLLLHNEVALLN